MEPGKELQEDLAEELFESVAEIWKSIKRIRPEGMGHTHVRVLSAIRDNPGLTATSLQGFTDLSAPTISEALNGLFKTGLIEKRPHPGDRRKQALFLTRKGGEVLQAVRNARLQSLSRAVQRLSYSERLCLEEALSVMEKVALDLKRERRP